ncbi:MAG: hypothetical protein COV01_03170 [Candidatus Taylorbacteria bacterium CG10_big_fil_rev_8_21_14_0_10_41_48]|uniref:Uncharacterized protein n=1 Tax=Candidatus Taylorbacteria bacterium CG10_big_fil_rev_8_21_14_0_10_41_48 TaxID=1975024 RepID=A0A2M8LBU5_9BACT|nr:MAG: hypothetical protein COV01_03170 [Candidatus Taylorbacteria bacterium CG10_big_fil_rev_8_21_14_0_10_41_48]
MTPSINHLAYTPTCLAEELELTREFVKDIPQRRKEFIGLMAEFPALKKFFLLVNRRLDNSAVNVIWFRIWIAMRAERRMGESYTITALMEIPDFDPDDVPHPPESETKLITYYIGMMDMLIQSCHTQDTTS